MQIRAASCALLLAFSMAHANGSVRTYFIAADNVTWDYAPKDRNVLFDRAFGDEEAFWVKTGDYTIGKVFKKAIYREYTDGTFKTL